MGFACSGPLRANNPYFRRKVLSKVLSSPNASPALAGRVEGLKYAIFPKSPNLPISSQKRFTNVKPALHFHSFLQNEPNRTQSKTDRYFPNPPPLATARLPYLPPSPLPLFTQATTPLHCSTAPLSADPSAARLAHSLLCCPTFTQYRKTTRLPRATSVSSCHGTPSLDNRRKLWIENSSPAKQSL